MNNKQTKNSYSIAEVDKIMEKYIQTSANRLAGRLKIAWKKNSLLRVKNQYVKN